MQHKAPTRETSIELHALQVGWNMSLNLLVSTKIISQRGPSKPYYVTGVGGVV